MARLATRRILPADLTDEHVATWVSADEACHIRAELQACSTGERLAEWLDDRGRRLGGTGRQWTYNRYKALLGVLPDDLDDLAVKLVADLADSRRVAAILADFPDAPQADRHDCRRCVGLPLGDGALCGTHADEREAEARELLDDGERCGRAVPERGA